MQKNKIDQSIIEAKKMELSTEVERVREIRPFVFDAERPVLELITMDYYSEESGQVELRGMVGLSLDFIREGGMAKLTGNSVKILLALISCIDHQGYTFVGQEHLAELTGLTARTIRDTMNELILNKIYADRLLVTSLKWRHGQKEHILYYVVDSKIKALGGFEDNDYQGKVEDISALFEIQSRSEKNELEPNSTNEFQKIKKKEQGQMSKTNYSVEEDETDRALLLL